MRNLDNKGFFLVETLIVTTVVAVAMFFLYSQMAKLMDGYELRLTYNTVNGVYAATEINDYMLNDSTKYATITGSANIGTLGFVEVPCTTFTNATYCQTLYDSLGVDKVIVTEYNTADIKSFALTEATFSDNMKLFIRNIEKVSGAPATDYRVIIEFDNGTFSTMKLNAGRDTVAPTISSTYPVLYVVEGESYNINDRITATDNVYGDISDDIVCVFVSGTTYNCTATDSSGNTSSIYARTITTVSKVATFSYTGAAQTFTALVSGFYKIELWGAMGGPQTSTYSVGGDGAYASGIMYLASASTLSVYVGGMGVQGTGSTQSVGGWNGGGKGGKGTTCKGGSGGGATDIRQGGTALANRILVAAGAGGGNGRCSASHIGDGGDAGILIGEDGNYTTETFDGFGGTQSAGGAKCTYNALGTPTNGALGVGGVGGYYSTTYGAGGGGGGYYGGGGGCSHYGAGGGGSSYVSSAMLDPRVFAGDNQMPTWDGLSLMSGNQDNGYVKITLLNRS